MASRPAYAKIDNLKGWREAASLPRIHAASGEAMGMVPENERGFAVDLGACHGLLCARAVRMGWSGALGLEMNQSHVDEARELAIPGVEMLCTKMDVSGEGFSDHFRTAVSLRAGGRVVTILARRVLSELFGTTYGMTKQDATTAERCAVHGRAFTLACAAAGVRYMMVEGRATASYANTPNRHPLWSVEQEMDALGRSSWTPVGRHKDAVLLRLKGNF
jgi:hypothetical protein